MSIDYEKIADFLETVEKDCLIGYVPCRKKNFTGTEDPARCGEPIGRSGVTISIGLDLGQQTAESLKKMRLPDTLVGVYTPYLGLVRRAAMDALAAAPLEITQEQSDDTAKAVISSYVSRTATSFNFASKIAPFAELPWQAQVVLVSGFFQMGSWRLYPLIWDLLIRGKWQDAAGELDKIHEYKSRRAKEAALLREMLPGVCGGRE